MKNIGLVSLFVIICLPHTLFGASLLKAQSFPATANDISFSQKLVLQQEGYEPWEKEYDKSGRCISGCTYPGITIQEDLRLSQDRTLSAWQQTQAYLQQQRMQQQQQNNTSGNRQQEMDSLSQKINDWVEKQKNRTCPVSNPDVPVGQSMPFGMPLTGNPRITSGYGQRTHPVSGNLSIHEGVDFSATVGTPVFTPASGTVSAVWTDSTCGNGLRIAHINGYETVYCHLNKVLVNRNDKVEAGCKVAESGNSGRTTGPHLHYGIKRNGEYIDPTNWIYTKN